MRNDANRACYTILVSQVLKPRDGVTLSEISVIDTHPRSDVSIDLKESESVVLFVQQEPDHSYTSYRELHPDLPSDALKVRGLRLFLRLMDVRDKVSQRRQCLAAWNSSLSDPEKWSILDVMWESRTSEYSHTGVG